MEALVTKGTFGAVLQRDKDELTSEVQLARGGVAKGETALAQRVLAQEQHTGSPTAHGSIALSCINHERNKMLERAGRGSRHRNDTR